MKKGKGEDASAEMAEVGQVNADMEAGAARLSNWRMVAEARAAGLCWINWSPQIFVQLYLFQQHLQLQVDYHQLLIV